ncbi:uncharacterized protein CTHT_0003260 [Thermochaetoides thermophila DSM 1495]|uniref:Methyltransferase type 11 domain-containing protein n=1 Tax=Chaetomium thermophilum (strain DSM 1495 / CBS 144.50 / IMI 039719) TaxID=759272 RepID=G0RZK3_CHATD|nr:hypothetical protein CTHT_0003260 [Thermochaetoides thermophila DSM 1495]EGS23631.1 hypothetical protein CTHT_0003260 [Thermochaetoides thermophila DSM 1495]
MSDTLYLPRTTYRQPSPLGRRRLGRPLNPIIEEPEQITPNDASFEEKRVNINVGRPQTGRHVLDRDQLISPMSDHFPTPRGQHFLPAPILPATPSCVSSEAEPDLDHDDTSSEASSSNPSISFRWAQQRTRSSNRDSIMTDVTEFDDLEEFSEEDEIQRKERLQTNGVVRRRSSTRSARRASRASVDLRKSLLAPLVIPEQTQSQQQQTTMTPSKKLTSPIPPTPPSAVTMSPLMKTIMEMRQAQEIPRASAPPSLDGSINSEELAQMSAPPTPMIGSQVGDDEDWTGVRLQPDALETLQALTSHESDFEEEASQEEPVIEVPVQQEMTTRQRLPPLFTNTGLSRHPSFRSSLAGLTRLEIPSPGGFFAELSSASRRTWAPERADDLQHPPTSTTAENFYKIPWNRMSEPVPQPPARSLHFDGPSEVVEHVIEVPVNENEDDLPTAIRIEETPVPLTARKVPATPQDPEEPVAEPIPEEPASPNEVNEIITAGFRAKQQEPEMSHMDRTAMWLAAQRAYFQGVMSFSEDAQEEEQPEPEPQVKAEVEVKPEFPPKDDAPAESGPSEPKKKEVRFSDVVIKADIPRRLPSKLQRQESAYYRAFTDALIRACPTDVFVCRQTRFEALQAQRVSLKAQHRNQLLGKFQLSVVPESAKKRMSANVVRGDDELIEDPEKLRADKEAEALSQMRMGLWQVAAIKALNGGRLISAPVAKRLARQSCMAPGPDGLVRDRARILDLAGQGTCDWAWHVALQYPNTKIYTVTTKAIRQLSNSNIRGPSNHRQVAVKSLAKLPFADNQFDLISARELHAVLKLFGENGIDEWDACLRECMRVLKPGGYLEFSLLDADIVNAGPLGNAKAVEFGFTLQTLGYDPTPTRSFLARLQALGFDDVRRAWICLPLGPKNPPRSVITTTPNPDASGADPRASTATQPKTHILEAIVSGSVDNVAAISGLAAGWSWERWLLRTEMEKAAGELRLCDTVTPGKAMHEAGKMIADVHAVVEEGRQLRSCWRVLKGYARKPRGWTPPASAAPSVRSSMVVPEAFPMPPAIPVKAVSPPPSVPVPPVPTQKKAVAVTKQPEMMAVDSVPMVFDLERSGSIRICLDTASLLA